METPRDSDRTPSHDLVNEVLAELRSALGARDRAAAVRVLLQAVEAGTPLETLYGEVIEPFLVSVGGSWQAGATAVWEEHVATAAVRTALEALYPRVLERKAATPRVPVTVVLACPADETHDLGLRILADRFDLRGFDTVFLGAATPAGEVAAAARAVGARLVCLSVSTHYQRSGLRDAIALLERELPDVRVVVGGAAFRAPAPNWADYLVGDLAALMDELEAEASR